MLNMILQDFKKLTIAVSAAILLAACASTPLDYAGQQTGLLCYMAIHDHDEVATRVVLERIPGGVESDQCQALSVQYRQELLRERAAKRKQAELMLPGSSEDPYKSETPDLPVITI